MGEFGDFFLILSGGGKARICIFLFFFLFRAEGRKCQLESHGIQSLESSKAVPPVPPVALAVGRSRLLGLPAGTGDMSCESRLALAALPTIFMSLTAGRACDHMEGPKDWEKNAKNNLGGFKKALL